tara:strand:- start:34 stop:237 length:204 start_codon:yes stop_codon:yes gene_type:complete
MVKISPAINSLFYSKKYKEIGTILRIVLVRNRIKIFVEFITGNKETFFVTADKLMYNKNNNIWYKIV